MIIKRERNEYFDCIYEMLLNSRCKECVCGLSFRKVPNAPTFSLITLDCRIYAKKNTEKKTWKKTKKRFYQNYIVEQEIIIVRFCG